MEKQLIELHKERDLGQVINATFTFIAQEIKPMAKMLSIVVPAFLIVSILKIYVDYRTNMAQYVDHDVSIFLSGGYWFTMFLFAVVQLITQSLLAVSVYSYMKLYLQKGKDGFEFSDFVEEVRLWFWSILGSNVLLLIIIIFAFCLLIIPGIYIAIPLSLLTAVMIFEEKNSFSEAYSRSFYLVKNNWWWTFLLMLVLMLIIGSIAMIIAGPFMLYSFLQAFHAASSPTDIATNYASSTMTMVGSAIQTLFSYLSYFIFYVAYAFQYFNLLEQKDKPSLLEKVEELGNSSAS